MHSPDFEVAVIGGSHAGLAAALTLGRSKRHTILFDTGAPRNRFAAHSHNFSGRDGHSAATQRNSALEELTRYPSVHICMQPVVAISAVEHAFRVVTSERSYTVRKVILATGVTAGHKAAAFSSNQLCLEDF
jgi:thioredoxin reductase